MCAPPPPPPLHTVFSVHFMDVTCVMYVDVPYTLFHWRHVVSFTGFCMFVLSLVKKHYRLQFYMVCISQVIPSPPPPPPPASYFLKHPSEKCFCFLNNLLFVFLLLTWIQPIRWIWSWIFIYLFNPEKRSTQSFQRQIKYY